METDNNTELNNNKDELLRREHDFSQNILNTAQAIILVLDVNGCIVKFNPYMEEISGYRLEEVIGKDWFSTFLPKGDHDKIRELFKEAVSNIQTKGNVNPIVSKDGREIFIEWYDSTLKAESGKIIGVLAIGQDITKRRAMEKERELLNLELKQKNKEFEQIISITSHDLRSPLVNVDGYSKILGDSIKELKCLLDSKDVPLSIREKIEPVIEEGISESLNYISNSISKMGNLLSGMSMILRTGRVKFIIEDIDMNEIITDVINNNQMKLNDTGIKLEISTLPTCKGDKHQINQVFSNLIDNAVNYLDSNRTGIIKISGDKERDKSVYCVEDNGVGIAPEHQKNIFNIFHRLEPKRVKGEGLGLTIVQSIIERHKGMIWVESEIGKGSKFFVSLPKE